MNLLVNAIRYTPAGGQILLSAAWEEQGGERFLALGVADTGVGIAPEEQESLFHLFERGQTGREGDWVDAVTGETLTSSIEIR